MSAIGAIGAINQYQNIQQIAGSGLSSGKTAVKESAFGGMFEDLLKKVSVAELQSAQNIELLATGDIQSISKAIVGMAETELTINYTLAIRNKLVDAYKEIMQMQV